MMHGNEKSDSAIVAVKPTNKAGNRRRSRWSQGRDQRNASQQSTRRLRTGKRVTSAGSCTESSKARKKERFTALFHHITIETLRLSFFASSETRLPA